MKNKNFILIFIVILISVFTYFIINYVINTKDDYINVSKKILFQEASSLFNNIVDTRKWSSDHGAVYIKAHDGIKPNPYLKDNHTYTKDNELLIKVNPAWMTRQISEISNERKNYRFKITSLQPINPNNIPDDFEKRALLFLKENKNSKYFTSLEEDKFNFFGSLKVEKSCLSCHTTQNYKIGDSIGGLRVSVPIENYKQNIEIITSKTNLLYYVIIATSIFFIYIITFTINSIYTRERNILRLNKTLEKKVNDRTKKLQEANEKLVKISTMDYLTDIPNRRYLFEMGKKAFFLAQREKEPLSLICIDIDFFKKINDTYGHQIGDEILKHISNLMNKQIRKSDILSRTGGEEFSIMLNNTDEKGAFILAEKIREIIENTNYKDDKYDIKSTISLGVSQIKENDIDLGMIMARADEALYKAKNSGRNKTVL